MPMECTQNTPYQKWRWVKRFLKNHFSLILNCLQVYIDENQMLYNGVHFPSNISAMAKIDLIYTKYQNNIDDLHYEDYMPMLHSLKEQNKHGNGTATVDFKIQLVSDKAVSR